MVKRDPRRLACGWSDPGTRCATPRRACRSRSDMFTATATVKKKRSRIPVSHPGVRLLTSPATFRSAGGDIARCRDHCPGARRGVDPIGQNRATGRRDSFAMQAPTHNARYGQSRESTSFLSRRISAIEASGSGIALSWNVAPTAPLHLSLLVGVAVRPPPACRSSCAGWARAAWSPSPLHPVRKGSQHLTERGDQARRKTQLLKGETERKRIGIPYLGDVQ